MVTGYYAGACALFMLSLAWRVVSERRRAKVGLGDGGDEALQRAIRVHANFLEYVPLALVLLLIYEMSGAKTAYVNAFGLLLLLSRVMHAAGLGRSAGYSRGRYLGTLGTWVAIAALSVLLMIEGFPAILK